MAWPWGTYLGEEALARGHPREDLELAAHPRERRPARLEGDGRLPQLDARGQRRPTAPATTRRSCSRPKGPSPTAPARRSSSVNGGTISTPDLSTGILHGITRDSIITIARDRGYEVRERSLIRSDLYLADEVFMCGTAAEVTPLRSVDDHELGGRAGDARAAEGLPRGRARARASSTPQWRELVPSMTRAA